MKLFIASEICEHCGYERPAHGPSKNGFTCILAFTDYTRSRMHLLKNSDLFIRNVDKQFDEVFGKEK